MCFSPTASFTASVALGTIGVATLSKVKNPREVPLAFIPLIFALQQAIEGFLWLSLLHHTPNALMLSYVFAFFALAWWPVYVPLTMYILESQPMQKSLMLIFFCGGVIFAVVQYGIFLYRHEAASIVNQCIYYHIQTPFSSLFQILYGLATVGAGLFSSRRTVQIFSLFAGFFALVSWRYYTTTFASVWCFFAAVLSFMLWFHFAHPEKN